MAQTKLIKLVKYKINTETEYEHCTIAQLNNH